LRQRHNSHQSSARNEAFIIGTDVVVKYVLEGHDRGVNWASFHPKGSYIVSASDDRTIRVWHCADQSARELEVLRGHSNNVSCVIFHPSLDIVISNSEDRSIKIWDFNRRVTISSYRKETDRFWVLAAHPKLHVLAAGFDTGFMVFGLEKEKVPAVQLKDKVFFVSKKKLKMIDTHEVILSVLNPPVKSTVLQGNPTDILVNSYSLNDTSILLIYEAESAYMLFTLPKNSEGPITPATGSGNSACFIGKDRFALLKKTPEIYIMDLSNTCKKKLALDFIPSLVLPGGLSKLLLQDDKMVKVYEVTTRNISKEFEAKMKRAYWAPNMEYVAVTSKFSVNIYDKKLDLKATSPLEKTAIKSVCWEASGVLIYASDTQVKYLLLNGDSGTLILLAKPLYIVSLKNNELKGIDREGDMQKLKVNCTEFKFKLALHTKRYNEVMQLLQAGSLCGNAIVSYLTDKKFPEIALYFVEDEKMRFNLAIQAGIIEVALDSCYKLNTPESWQRLSLEALKQGNAQIVEMAYQKTRNLDRLAFLYLITGNLTKLSKMQRIAQNRKDKQRLFNTAINRGDIEQRVEVLAETGHIPLAYLAAKTHGLSHLLGGPLEESLGEQALAALDEYLASTAHQQQALYPPVPIFDERHGGGANWPLLNIITSEFELLKNQTDPANPFSMAEDARKTETHDFAAAPSDDAWGNSMNFDIDEPGKTGWGGNVEFDLPDVEEPVEETLVTTSGMSFYAKWSRTCSVAGELIAAGSFQQAMQVLTKTVGITNFSPLKALFLHIYMAPKVQVSLLPQVHSNSAFSLTRKKTLGTSAPFVAISLVELTNLLKQAYKLTSNAAFTEALREFTGILQRICLLSVQTEREEAEARELVKICVEYIACMRLELEKQRALSQGNKARGLELAYYMSLCALQPPHQLLTLRSAVSMAYAEKNLITCASLCKRFLELVTQNPSLLGRDAGTVTDKHKKLLAYCQRVYTNDLQIEAELPDNSPDIASLLCMHSFTPVGPSIPTSRCPFCLSVFHKQVKGALCDTCQVAQIGLEALGLKVLTNL
jgi:coatomer protein complex subunit alpha (xenin)